MRCNKSASCLWELPCRREQPQGPDRRPVDAIRGTGSNVISATGDSRCCSVPGGRSARAD